MIRQDRRSTTLAYSSPGAPLDCVTTTYLPDGILDQLPLACHLGRTRIGGVDLNKPRIRAALAAVLALSAAPPASLLPTWPPRSSR